MTRPTRSILTRVAVLAIAVPALVAACSSGGGGAARRRARAVRRGPDGRRIARSPASRPTARRRSPSRCDGREADRDDRDRPGRHRDRDRRRAVADRGRQLRRARGVRLLRRRRVPPHRARASSSRAATGSTAARPTSIPRLVGTGGPPYTIKDEPVTTPYSRGTVAMARTPEPDSVGSQFFIVLDDAAPPRRLRPPTRTRSSAASRPGWRRSTRSPRCRPAPAISPSTPS